MSKIENDCYSVQASLEKIYYETKQSMAFEATTVDEWKTWHQSLKDKLEELLGGFPKRDPLEPQILETEDCCDYIREKVVFNADHGLKIPTYFLIPKGLKGPVPGILALHGHGDGKINICDIDFGEEKFRKRIEEFDYAYAVEMVREGYAVLAPDLRCFGELDADETGCHKPCINAIILGTNIIALRVSDIMQCVDYMQSRSEVIGDRIACLGLSGGGLATLWATIFEPRIKAAVISGYFCNYKESVFDINHCSCNYVPGILKYAELQDITALIAPTPLLIQNGENDPIFPIKAVRREYTKVKSAYELLGAGEKVDIDILMNTGHKWNGKRPAEWLKKWL